MTSLPRGLRNNNPLNIRRSSQPWRGKVANPTDKDFEQFISMEDGLRAAFVILAPIPDIAQFPAEESHVPPRLGHGKGRMWSIYQLRQNRECLCNGVVIPG